MKKTLGFSRSVVPLWCFFVSVVLLFSLGGIFASTVNGTMYIPAPPQGPQHGFVNIEYQYEIVTVNTEASWLFDWGDGTSSDWLSLQNGSTSILQSHEWVREGEYQVKVLFRSTLSPEGLWSDPLVVVISPQTRADFPSKPYLVSGCVEGVNGSPCAYTVSATDPHGYRLQYRCDWGDNNTSAWTALVSSDSIITFLHSWDVPGNYSIRIQTSNEYSLDSSWSSPISVVIRNASNVNQSVKYFLLVDGIADFMVYRPDHTGSFLNTSSKVSSRVAWQGEGTYYLDDDNDGRWEYIYIPEQGVIQPLASPLPTVKTTQFQIPWLIIYIILGVVVGVVAIVVILVKTGYLYLYEDVENSE